MHRPVIFSSLLTFFVAAGVILIAGSFLLPAEGPPTAASSNTDVIRRFYAAANETIATGDTRALQAVVAPHFVDQDPVPGMKPDRGGLESYLSALHALVPDMELLVEAVVAGGDQAMVRVAIHDGHGPTSLHGAVLDQSEPWGRVDVFRIAGGKVVERWGQTDDLALIGAATEVTLDIPTPSPRVISLDQLTFESSASWSPAPSGPRLVFLESGVLRLNVATQQILTLSPGESSLVPAGADFAMSNPGGEEARVLMATFSEPRSPGGAPTANVLPPGVASKVVAGGLATDVRVGPASLSLAQVTLARNARLTVSSADGPVLVAVETGHLAVETWGRGWLHRETDGSSAWLVPGSDGISGDPREQVIAHGDGLLMHEGGLARLQIMSDGPAVVCVLTLRALN